MSVLKGALQRIVLGLQLLFNERWNEMPGVMSHMSLQDPDRASAVSFLLPEHL